MSDVVKFQRTSELDAYVVYGVLYRCKDRFIYIGHTMRFNVRKSEHYNLCSGARRVATLFAQQAFQPREEVFDIVVLWQGNCSLLQAKAVEQAFMDKYNTRVYPRPSNGVTVDIDLMQPCVDPMQLNIDMACKDVSSMEWANRTLAAYTAFVEKEMTANGSTGSMRIRTRADISFILAAYLVLNRGGACVQVRRCIFSVGGKWKVGRRCKLRTGWASEKMHPLSWGKVEGG